MTECAIRVDVHQPKIRNGEPTGLLEFVRMRTYGDLKKQLENTLRDIDMPSWECNAFEAAEYISFHQYKQNEDTDLPKGELIVIARQGKCEGMRIELMVRDDNFNCVPIIAVKYLTDRDGVWQVAKDVDEACNNGLYGY